MGQLVTDPRFDDPDVAYNAIIDAHRGLSDEESQEMNSRLILLLANHIGDIDVLRAALKKARGDQ